MEFESEDYDIHKCKIGTLVSTVGMSEVMESFGSFPAKYYVRQEELSLLNTM